MKASKLLQVKDEKKPAFNLCASHAKVKNIWRENRLACPFKSPPEYQLAVYMKIARTCFIPSRRLRRWQRQMGEVALPQSLTISSLSMS